MFCSRVSAVTSVHVAASTLANEAVPMPVRLRGLLLQSSHVHRIEAPILCKKMTSEKTHLGNHSQPS